MIPSRFLIVMDDERSKGMIEFSLGRAYLHLEIRRRFAGLRHAREIFPKVRAWLKSMGYRWVYVIIPEGDTMLKRFEESFGFQEDYRKNHFIFMRQRT